MIYLESMGLPPPCTFAPALAALSQTCKLCCVPDQCLNTAAKDAETLILGLSPFPAHIDLLDDHRQFEVREDHIIVYRGEVALALLCIHFHKGLPAHESGQISNRWQYRLQFLRVAGRHPVAQRNSQVKERITNRCHLPIQHRNSLCEIVRIEKHIVQLEVVMDQGRRRTLWHMRHKPAGERLHLRYVVCLGTIVAFDPALHLAFEETLGMTKFIESSGMPIDSMNLYQRFDHHLGDLFAKLSSCCHSWRKGGIQNHPFAPFHHVERRTQDSRIIAENIGEWCK